MRHTSVRRRSEKSSKAIRQDDLAKPITPRGAGPLARPANSPDAAQCPDCEFWIVLNATGTLKAHAAGGFGPRLTAGRPACKSSGSLGGGERAARRDGIDVRDVTGIEVYVNDEPGDPNPGIILDVVAHHGRAMSSAEARALASQLRAMAKYLDEIQEVRSKLD